MKPEVILHSFGYLTQAAATTVAVSFAGIVFGFVIGALVCVARVSPRPWLKRLGGSLCQRVSRRSAARAAPVRLLFSRRIRARRAGDRGGGRRARAVVGGLSGGDPARRAQRRAARAGRGGDRARLLRPRYLAAHSSAAGAEDFDAAAHQRVHPADQGLVARFGGRHRRTDARQHEHRDPDLSAARGLCRRRPVLSRDQPLPGGAGRAGGAAPGGGRRR